MAGGSAEDKLMGEYVVVASVAGSSANASQGQTPAFNNAGARGLPTLATFSLQGKVGVVTGGAGGLGLVMGRKLITTVLLCPSTSRNNG